MAVTRRFFVSGALAAPLLAQLGGDARAQSPDRSAADPVYTLLEGMVEFRATELALTRLAAEQIGIEAVSPAIPITGDDGDTVTGVVMAPEYATGTVALTGQPGEGRARGRGGMVLVSARARMEIAGIRGSSPDNRVFAFLKVGEEWVGELPVYTGDLSTVRLEVLPGAPGSPTVISGRDIPITATQEGLDAFAEAFGVALFSTEDVLFTGSGEGSAWPLPFLPTG